ncbi:ankyrin, partial [Plenodomus tracheiphilus IPT5]
SQHEKTHTKPFRRETCQRSFALRLDLSRHIIARHRVGHVVIRCYVERCTFITIRKDNLQRHLRQMHQGIPKACKYLPTVDQNYFEDTMKMGLALSSDTQFIHQDSLRCPSIFLQAATSGNLALLERFLAEGVDINMKGDDNMTAVHCAARAGQAATVQFLLESGAKKYTELTRFSKFRDSALYQALLSLTSATFDMLLRHSTKGVRRFDDLRHLERQVERRGNEEIRDAYFNYIKEFFSAQFAHEVLAVAIKFGYLAEVAMFLDLDGIDLNLRVRDHSTRTYTFLHLAVIYHRTEIVKLFLSFDGLDVTAKISKGYSALQLAACKGYLDIVEVLLNHRTTLADGQTLSGNNALHLAARHGNTNIIEVVKILLEQVSVDATIPDENQQTPLQNAAFRGNWDVVKLLLDYFHLPISNRTSSEDVSTQECGDKGEVVRRLCIHPDFTDINICDSTEWGNETLLHKAAEKGDSSILRVLLAHKDLNVNCLDRFNHTPLMRAINDNKKDAVELLLQHKDIDVNYRFGHYETALSIAKRFKRNDIVDLLLAHGAIDDD